MQIYVDFSAPTQQPNAIIFTCQSEPISLGRASTILPFSLLVLYYLNILSAERQRCKTFDKTYEADDSFPLREFICRLLTISLFFQIAKTQRKTSNLNMTYSLSESHKSQGHVIFVAQTNNMLKLVFPAASSHSWTWNSAWQT